MDNSVSSQTQDIHLAAQIHERAEIIARAGGLECALEKGVLPIRIDATTSELIVLGLLRQNVQTYFCVFGHGSTELGEVLRIYESVGLVRCLAVRHETEAAHAATALRWTKNEKSAVLTSIGPGALQAMAGALASASDGVGVWHLYGDETTGDEGPNMQQIPRHEQNLYLKLCSIMGDAYCLHTPNALPTALRRGFNTVDHPYRAGPYFLLMPINTQSYKIQQFNLETLPVGEPPRLGPAGDAESYSRAIDAINRSEKTVVRVGGGARDSGLEISELLELIDAVAVVSPVASGVLPYDNLRNMTVGGSKGSLSGNYAMKNADLLIAIGSRAVCQSDCSRTGYPNVRSVININTDLRTATHYNKSIALVGDASLTLQCLIEELKKRKASNHAEQSPWLKHCIQKRCEWDAYKSQRYDHPQLYDDVWCDKVLTQPAAIKIATDWARKQNITCFFDAGDVQANGFQVVEDDRLGRTYTETGASYMGFAVSALLATAAARVPFTGLALTGDGSFTMNPQILIDGVQHGAKGIILLMDNRRMGAISNLQMAQYGEDFATNDTVETDYLAWARSVKGVMAVDGGRTPEDLRMALERAIQHRGLALIHLPVYFGSHELGGLGTYGRWNVGNWVEETETIRHDIGL